MHKGSAGRIAIIAGSPGMTGAAALAAMGALSAGAGLVSVFTHPEAIDRLAPHCPPEAMLLPWPEHGLQDFPADTFDAIAIGPGIARHLDASIPGFFQSCPVPLLVDADAITALAGAFPLAGTPAGPRLLTPHPGEFARIFPKSTTMDRIPAAMEFARSNPDCTLLLKGPGTIVAKEGQPLAVNQTGNPGLATGGSGDLLAGIATALLARIPNPWATACAAAWLHGRAAESVIKHHGYPTQPPTHSAESLTPSACAGAMGAAWRSLRRRDP